MKPTAFAPERAVRPTPSSLYRRIIAGPRQGWLAVLLLGVMLAVVGIAVDESGWVLNPAGQSATWWLPVAMVTAGLIGFLFAVSRLSTAGSHLVAAVIGAAVIVVASAVSVSSAPTLLSQLRELSDSFSVFVNEVFVLEVRSDQTSAPLIVIGALGWTSGYFAAFNVFRRNRGTPAVVSVGLVLLVNMSVTSHAQYGYLIAFTLAAMLLLVRLNIVDQSVGWQRRHIGSTASVSALFLRGGAVFVAITLLGAVFLAATASSAPLAGIWQNLDEPFLNLGASINQLVGGISGATRNTGGMFGPVANIQDVWFSSNDAVLATTSSDGHGHYLRGETFETFDGHGWHANGGGSQQVAPGADVAAGTSDRDLASSRGRTEVVVTVGLIAPIDATLLAPDSLVSTDKATNVRTAGGKGPIEQVTVRGSFAGGQQYTVTSMIPNISGDGGLTASELAAAGTAYPAWVREHYLDTASRWISPLASEVAATIRAQQPPDELDPYHLAHAIQDYFTAGTFTYITDVSKLCGPTDAVDCVLRYKQGFCQHYASAMTLMLRTLEIPARFVEGYLPGTAMGGADKETYLVTAGASHAWVEVYFPSYGWIRFDPTPGNADNGRVSTELPAGTPVTASPSPEASIDAASGTTSPSPEPTQDPSASVVPPAAPPDPGAIGLYVVTAVIVAAIALALFSRRRRRPGSRGDQTFDRVARLAARLGYAPRPSQTTYEYAGSLGEIVPALKPELHVVATAKVEATYGRRTPTKTSLAAIGAAYARIRRSLLLLFFQPRRPKPPRS